jgi:hypothetical protein
VFALIPSEGYVNANSGLEMQATSVNDVIFVSMWRSSLLVSGHKADGYINVCLSDLSDSRLK